MNTRAIALLWVVVAHVPSGMPAQPGTVAFHNLVRAKSLRCLFDRGTAGRWDSTGVTLEPTQYGDSSSLIFVGIDPKTLTARFPPDRGGGALQVVPTGRSLTLIEEDSIAGVNITTVFGRYRPGSSTEFLAVHSRHAAGVLGGLPLPVQYHGVCRAVP